MLTNNPAIIARRLQTAATRAARLVLAAALVTGTAAALYFSHLDLTLSHYDARAHLVVARRVIDSLTPGWRQLGGVWLPLPHLIDLVPVQWDWLYRTGACAVAVSIAALAWGLSALAGSVARHSGSIVAAVSGAIVILLNPNVLYLQSTPMTEALLFGLSLVALASVDRWIAAPDRITARRVGLVMAALVLTRYEGWFIAAGLGAIGAWALRRRGWRTALAPAPWPITAVLAFLALSRASTGVWFVTSGFFVPTNPARDHPAIALLQIGSATLDLAGPLLLAAAAAGALVCAGRVRSAPGSALPLALLLSAVLPFGAFVDGHPLRVRYMVPLVVASGALAAVLIGVLPRRLRVAAAAVLVVGTALLRPPLALDAPMVLEAQWEQPHRLAREAVTAYLRAHYDGTPILASMGSLAHYMQDTAAIGLDIGHYVHEGNGDLWTSALRSPREYVRWILIEEVAEGGDMLADRARHDPAFLSGFTRVAQGGGLALYRRSD
jgi:hypothetical protein